MEMNGLPSGNTKHRPCSLTHVQWKLIFHLLSVRVYVIYWRVTISHGGMHYRAQSLCRSSHGLLARCVGKVLGHQVGLDSGLFCADQALAIQIYIDLPLLATLLGTVYPYYPPISMCDDMLDYTNIFLVSGTSYFWFYRTFLLNHQFNNLEVAVGSTIT